MISNECYQNFSCPPSVMMNLIAQANNTIYYNIDVTEIYIADSTKNKIRTVSD